MDSETTPNSRQLFCCCHVQVQFNLRHPSLVAGKTTREGANGATPIRRRSKPPRILPPLWR
jgi:hypothetical protein